MWCEQNAKGVGELHLKDDEIESVKNNKHSKIVFLDGVWELAGKVFLQIPFDYGFAGAVGKKYEAIKDFLKWHNFKVKEWTPIFIRGGEIWASNLEKKK